jgi:hypothetical protein
MIGRRRDVLLGEIGLLAGDVGEADRVPAYLRLRLLQLELEVVAARHVETSPEKGLVDAVVLDREVLVPASIAGELGHEEVPRPIRFEADLGSDLEGGVRLGVELRIEHVIGEDGADLGLGEKQERPELHPDGDVRIEIVARRRENPMAREILCAWQLKAGLARLGGNAELGHLGYWRRLGPQAVRGCRFGRPWSLIADAAKGRRTRFGIGVGPGLRTDRRLLLAGVGCGGRGGRSCCRCGGALRADAAPQRLAGRILCACRRGNASKQGCSESVRCA